MGFHHLSAFVKPSNHGPHGPFAKDQEDLTKLHAEEAEKRRLERKAENQMVLEYKLES